MIDNIEFLNTEIKRIENKIANIFINSGRFGMFANVGLFKKDKEEVNFLFEELSNLRNDRIILLRQQQEKVKIKRINKITFGMVVAAVVIGGLVVLSKK